MPQRLPSAAVTQRDVARALGLSHSTVSLALRDNPRIPKARRDEVRKVAEAMGYRPNPAAAALAHFKKSSTVMPIRAAVAWLNFWPDPKALRRYAEFDRYWRGASAAAEKLGFHLEEIIGAAGVAPERIESILSHRGITGILIPPHHGNPDWGGFRWERFSTIRFGRSVTTPGVHVVTADQVSNTVLAFNKIRSRGYERVGFITGMARERGHLFEAGFLFAQRSIDEELRLPIFTVTNPQDGNAALVQWLKQHKPDAVFSDLAETPAMLKKAGYRVPEDIGLAVSSTLDIDADAGIYQNPEEVGRVAMLSLVSLMGDNDRGTPPIFRQILVEGTWVDGSSLPAM